MLGYRITGDPIYRRWGWQIFQSFQKHCRVDHGGYAGLEDVQVDPPKLLDKMETFWLGETLSELHASIISHEWLPLTYVVEYLYLLFDDSQHIPLSENVFNTEVSPGYPRWLVYLELTFIRHIYFLYSSPIYIRHSLPLSIF